MAKIIAEVGSNHLGNRDLIIAYAQESKASGCSILKFQGWRVNNLSRDYFADDYSKEDIAYYDKCEIDYKDVVTICNDNNIQPLITAFDCKNIENIALAMQHSDKKIVKIASPDMLSWKLLDKAFNLFDEVIISTGMHSTKEIFQLGEYLRIAGYHHKAVLLHCTSKYPALRSDVNMARVEYIKSMGIRWGYSDHTIGIEAAVMACAMGAEYIEKHVTLSSFLPSRDASMSCSFTEMERISCWNNYFGIMRGGLNMKELTQHDYQMRKKYCGKWGNNK